MNPPAPAVNSAPAAIPTATVESASTTKLDDGRVALLVRTEAGPGRLVFSSALARSLFVITNPGRPVVVDAKPKSEAPPKTVAPAQIEPPAPVAQDKPARAPRRSHAECVELWQRLEREIAAEPKRYAAITRVCQRHGIPVGTFHSWRCVYRRSAAAAESRANGTPPTPPLRYPIAEPAREPIRKPCGALL